MLLGLFIIAVFVLFFAVLRRPHRPWQRIAMAGAVFVMLTVIMAWIIERIAQAPM